MQRASEAAGFAPKLFKFKVQLVAPVGKADGKPPGRSKTVGKVTVDFSQFCTEDSKPSPMFDAILPLKCVPARRFLI